MPLNTSGSFISNLNQIIGGSPWTRTIIVDGGGKGDYLTIKEACDYVITQTPGTSTPWTILVFPGVYNEDQFTVPPYTHLCALDVGGNYNYRHSSVEILFDDASGSAITLDTFSSISNFYIQWTQNSPSGACYLVDIDTDGAYDSVGITRCFLYPNIDARTHQVSALRATKSDIYVFDSTFTAGQYNKQTNVIVCDMKQAYALSMFIQCNFYPVGGSGSIGLKFSNHAYGTLSYCRIGSSLSTTRFNTWDIFNSGAQQVLINQTSYGKSSGTITNIDLASTSIPGVVKEMSAISDLNQTITDPPTQAEVQAISDKIDELLGALRTAGMLAS